MALQAHLTPATLHGNVLMASEVHLTPSISHGNVLTTSETLLTPSMSGISHSYSLGTQVKLPKLDLSKSDGAIRSGPRSGMYLNRLCTTIPN